MENNELSTQSATAPTLSKEQQLAGLTCLQKAVKAKVDELREDVTTDMLNKYEEEGSDRRIVRHNKEKLGTISLRKSKAKYAVTDEPEFEEYLKENGYAFVKRQIHECYISELIESLYAICESGKALEPSDFEFAIYEEVTPTKDFDKAVQPLDDGCMNKITGEMIPGIVAREEEVLGITVKTEDPLHVIHALTAGHSDQMQALLGE